MQQTVAAWRWAKVKFAAAACVGAVALVGVVFRGDLPGLGRPDSAALTATAATEVAAPMAPAAAHQPGIPPRLNGTETFRLHVIAADTGQPLPGAKVLLNFVANGEWFAPEDRETDGEGVCVIPLPRNVGRAGCRRAFSRLREPLFRVDFEVATPAPRRLHAQTGPRGNGRWTCGG
jgi:hypothetical protein